MLHKADSNGNRSSLNISVILAVNQTKDLEEYTFAYSTVLCYTQYRKYNFVILDFSKDDDIAQNCTHQDVSYGLFVKNFFVEKLTWLRKRSGVKTSWLKRKKPSEKSKLFGPQSLPGKGKP